MKEMLNFILTILTVAMFALLTFAKLNEFANWVDLTKFQTAINIVASYGPMVLLCGFAFGGMFGRAVSKIMFIVIVLLLVVFGVAIFAPDFIANIFGSGTTPPPPETEAIFNLLRF